MFTGIIEELGIVKSLIIGEESSKITIECCKVLKDTLIGDSIATNGICLTVTNIKGNSFEADIMEETFRRSNLGKLTIGSKVNLERALTLEKRLGGHIVSGHIDGVGKIFSLVKEKNAIWVTINAERGILKYIIEKGSIAVDGISLTVAYVDENIFKVSIIPHTGEETTLLTKSIGDSVNLECDMVGKYIEKLLRFNKIEEKPSSNITEEFLRNNGFM